jgi:molybdate transport system substrate-binding protein
VLAALIAAMLTGCGPSSTPQSPAGKIMVFAAASLKAPFTEIGEAFSEANPGAAVEFSFAGSSNLSTQLIQGDHADVFASADSANMAKVAKAQLLSSQPVEFAANALTIAVSPGNPKRIKSFGDLEKEDVSVVVCAPQVPCGSATQKLEEATGVELLPVSEESSVTDVLNKVTTGQADAGLVYVSDVIGAGDKVVGVAIPESLDFVNRYPIATLKQSQHPELAQKFVELVTGPVGQQALVKAGFRRP